MPQSDDQRPTQVVETINPRGRSSVVLVCEHASAHIPVEFDHLGLAEADRHSHVAWDPGALGVARALAAVLDATLVAGRVSRLVYDCNRPPEAPDAMPPRSEIVDIPGNANLDDAARQDRISRFYDPFRSAVAAAVAVRHDPVIVTIHSFTPVFHSQPREVEIGVLYDRDTRLADALLRSAPRHTQALVQRNAPYGPEHGVTHTLREHALPGGHPNVMLEIRNDLIDTKSAEVSMGKMLADWLVDAFHEAGLPGDVACTA